MRKLLTSLTEAWQRRRVRAGIRHLAGPREISAAADDVIVCSVVRDAGAYLPEFLDYYARLGARAIVLLDNGSSDDTREIARHCPLVTLLESSLPFKTFKNLFRRELVERYGAGCWTLSVDADEFFDYPRSSRLALRQLTDYLQSGGYTAMVGQMLDMFPERWDAGPRFQRAEHAWYDLSQVTTRPYRQPGCTTSNERIQRHFGGVRKDVFDLTDILLTKHPLLFGDGTAHRRNDSHRVTGAKVADLSGVLLHYKFAAGFEERVSRAVHEGQYYNGSAEYRRYQQVLDQEDAPRFPMAQADRWGSVDDLVDCGFLVVSESYEQFVRNHASRGTGGAVSSVSHPAADNG